MTEALRRRIDEMIRSRRIVVFMKGSSLMPMCGFSAAALDALRAAGAQDIATFDVLKDPELREGIKEYSQWPTIPQIYIDGQFIGGCDIVKEMHARGELAPLVAPKD